jgi:hypothetical protein
MKYDYYYNNVPGDEPCRNNLIYTSLISEDKKTFVQWYYNDTGYHKGKNQVVDPALMEEKWEREVKFLKIMQESYPMHIPLILDIDYSEKKIYLQVDGPDFWELSNCTTSNYDKVLPNWQEQMLDIIKSHKSLNLFKYSMHPSSYFIVDGKMKSINYFFTYNKDEPYFSLKDVESHIYSERQDELRKYIGGLGIEWNIPQKFETIEELCWNSFRKNYPNEFVESVLTCIK